MSDPDAYTINQAFENVEDDLREYRRAAGSYRYKYEERLEKSFADLARLLRKVPDVTP